MTVEVLRREIKLGLYFPRIVCLCGSTRFIKTFDDVNRDLTLRGMIVLSVGCHTTSDLDLGITEAQKRALDALHKEKIDLADMIAVLNVDGYIGDSTASEIAYAQSKYKKIEYLECEGLFLECGSGGCGKSRSPRLTQESRDRIAKAVADLQKEMAQ